MKKKKERELVEIERNRKREIGELEKRISEEELKLEELDRLLCDPAIYENSEKVVEITKNREEVQKLLDDLYDRWITLTEG